MARGTIKNWKEMEVEENHSGSRKSHRNLSLLLHILSFAMVVALLRFFYVMVKEGAYDERALYCFLGLCPLGYGKKPLEMHAFIISQTQTFLHLRTKNEFIIINTLRCTSSPRSIGTAIYPFFL